MGGLKADVRYVEFAVDVDFFVDRGQAWEGTDVAHAFFFLFFLLLFFIALRDVAHAYARGIMFFYLLNLLLNLFFFLNLLNGGRHRSRR